MKFKSPYILFLIVARLFLSPAWAGSDIVPSTPAVMATGSLTAPLPQTQKHVIALDPGHGGIDPGAVSASGVKEKDVVLALAQSLRQVLEATGRYEVVMTRKDDHFLKLEQRVAIARQNHAELFIALHADMLSDARVHGATIYTESDTATDAVASKLAQKENRADALGGVNLERQSDAVANVLVKLAQKESRADALAFAQKAVAAMHRTTVFTARPLRAAAFKVLKAPDLPSVLFELGYLSNPSDEAMLASPAWRAKMSEAFVATTNLYFDRLNSASAMP